MFSNGSKDSFNQVGNGQRLSTLLKIKKGSNVDKSRNHSKDRSPVGVDHQLSAQG